MSAPNSTIDREALSFTSEEVVNRFPLSENYFERVNTEYSLSLLMGNYNHETIKNIQSRNQINWSNWLGDFMQAPTSGLLWLTIRAFEGFSGIFHRIRNSRISQALFNNRFSRTILNWISETINITNPLTALRNQLIAGLTSPFHRSQELISQLSAIPIFEGIDFTSQSSINRAGLILERRGRRGQIANDIIKINRYLADNPVLSANASEEDLTSTEFWGTILDQLEITENRDQLIAIYTGEKTIQEVMSELSNSNDDLSPTLEADSPTEAPLESSEQREGWIPISQFTQQRMSNFQGLFAEIRHQAEQLNNEDKTLFLGIISSLSYLSRGHIISMVNSGASISSDALNTLIQLSRSTFSFGRSHPVALGTISAGMVGLLIATKDLDPDVLVPENPEEFYNWLKEELENNSEWEAFINNLPEEVKDSINISLEYAAGIREIPTIDTAEVTSFMSACVDLFVETIGLSASETILLQNRKGINSMMSYRLREHLEEDELVEISEILNQFLFQMTIQGEVTESMLNDVEQQLNQFDIRLVRDENGIIYWQKVIDEEELSYSAPIAFIINPSLSRAQQLDSARRFTIERTGIIGISDLVTIDARNRLNILNNPMENPEGVIDTIRNWIAEDGNMITIIGSELLLIPAEGAWIKFTGPIHIYRQLIGMALSDNSLDLEIHDMMVEYAQGVIPLLVYGTARSVVQRFRNGRFDFMTNLLWHGLAGPVVMSVKLPVQLGINLLHFGFSSISRRYRARYYHNLLNPENYSSRMRNFFFRENFVHKLTLANEVYSLNRLINTRTSILQSWRHLIPEGRGISSTFISRIDEAIEQIQNYDPSFAHRLREIGYTDTEKLRQLNNTLREYGQTLDINLRDGFRLNFRRRINTTTPRSTSSPEWLIHNSGSTSVQSPEYRQNAIPIEESPSRASTTTDLPARATRNTGRGRVVRRGIAGVAVPVILTGAVYLLSGGRANSASIDSTNSEGDDEESDPEPTNLSLETLNEQNNNTETQPYTDFDEIIDILNPELSNFKNKYNWLHEFLSHSNLISITEDLLVSEAQAIARIHSQTVQELKTLVIDNKDLFIQMFTEMQRQGIPTRIPIRSEVLELDFDISSQKVIILFTKENTLINTLYENVDGARLINSFPRVLGGSDLYEDYDREYNRVLSEHNNVRLDPRLTADERETRLIELATQAHDLTNNFHQALIELNARIEGTEVLKDILPFLGSARDLERVNREFGRGNVRRGFMNSLSFALGAALDISIIGSGLSTGMRAARASTRLSSIITSIANRTTTLNRVLTAQRNNRAFDLLLRHRNKFIFGAIGIDIVRSFLIPPSLDKQYLI